jgi:hypothetical protein
MLGAAERMGRYVVYVAEAGGARLGVNARAIHLACPNDALAAFEADQWRLGRYAELWCAERLVCSFAEEVPPPPLVAAAASRRLDPISRLKARRASFPIHAADRLRRRA